MLIAYGVCVVIAMILLGAFGFFSGSGGFLLVLILPVLFSETLTGERGTFSPNGSGRKSAFFSLLTAFFVGVEVLLLAGILFGIYAVIAVVSGVSLEPAISARAVLSALQLHQLQTINAVLWFCSTFIAVRLFNMIRYRQQIKQMTALSIAFGYVPPFLAYPLAVLFLAASRNYLIHYPRGDQYLGFFSKAAGIFYVLYVLIAQAYGLYVYLTVLRRHKVKLSFQYWFGFATSLLHKTLFVYFVIRIFSSL
jgi:hypothetical protein